MVKTFHVGDGSDAGFWSGILISAFAFSEALTGMLWGGLSDRVGRKPVLLMGCGGTMISLLIFGFSTNIWMALSGRVVGGILNGNIGVIQTMVGEMVKRPEHERMLKASSSCCKKQKKLIIQIARAYAVMPFVWSVGTIVGPAIGGIFADPSQSFPSVFSPSGLFGPDRFPYLLPNLICAALLFGSIISGYLFLEETHPDLQPWSSPQDIEHTNAHTPLIVTAGAIADAGADLTTESYGTFNTVDIMEDEKWQVNEDGSSPAPSLYEKPFPKVFSWRVCMLVVALGIFTYHSMTYDHLMPIFFQDSKVEEVSILAASPFSIPGGLGLTHQTVGLILSINGLIALFIQAVVFPLMAEWLGVWHLFVMVSILHPIAYFIVPYLAILPQGWLFPGIYTCLTVRNFVSILAYPLLLILLKQASPGPSCLGKINGLAASVGAGSRTIASPIAGLLYDLGSDVGFTGLAWWASGAVAIVGALQLWSIDRERNKAFVRYAAPCLATSDQRQDKTDVVRITVVPVESAEEV
ncbi:MAG: hypothetical protein Q9227_002864 [Pyrenula ochraceoflavens]